MSAKRPYRVVYRYDPQGKPATIVINDDRDGAERVASGIQERGGSAQVVLVQGKTRTVVTEYPAVDTDLIDPTDITAAVVTVVTMRTSGRVFNRLDPVQAARKALQIQRGGSGARIRRLGTDVRIYPAVTGDALTGVREKTMEEKFMEEKPGSTGETPVAAEARERKLDVQRLAEPETEGPLSRQLRALAEPGMYEDPALRNAITAHVDTLPAKYCPACGGQANVTGDPDLNSDGDAECTVCDWYGFATEVKSAPRSTPAQEAALAATLAESAGDVEPHEDKAGEPVPAPAETLRPPVRVEFNAEWAGGDSSEVIEYDRDTWDAMSTDQRRKMLDEEAADFMASCGASYGYTVLGDDEKPAPAAPSGGAFVPDLGRGGNDAEDALGGALGRAVGTLLRTANGRAGAGGLDPVLLDKLRDVAELVTERALAHRQFSCGGPDRHDIARAARNAYSDRFEGSDKLRRDHDAALTDAIDAVFDAVAQGGRRALMHPSYGLRQVAVRAKDGNHDPGYAWMVSNGGYYGDRDVTGWLELMPTGRVFDPARDES